MPVKPEPSPTNEPLNVEPEIAVAFVKSTTELDTINEPVIWASPFTNNDFPLDGTVAPNPNAPPWLFKYAPVKPLFWICKYP